MRAFSMKLDDALDDIVVTIDGLLKTPYASSKVDADQRTLIQERVSGNGW